MPERRVETAGRSGVADLVDVGSDEIHIPQSRGHMIELAPSILSADFARLGAEAAVQGGATVLQVDIMDGHFVPNITIGPAVVASLRKVSRVPLDCHLMIERPDEFTRRSLKPEPIGSRSTRKLASILIVRIASSRPTGASPEWS
jgi:hypothetical protein